MLVPLSLAIHFPLTFSIVTLDTNQNGCFTEDVSFNHGYSVAQKTTSTPEECQQFCRLVRLCSHFSFNVATSTCFLRQGDRVKTAPGYISGPQICPDPKEVNRVMSVCSGDVCLEGGRNKNEGNVLVNGGPVCDDLWGLEEAMVVCKQLRYPGVLEATVESKFGSTSSNYSMDRVVCEGNETRLQDCRHKKSDSCYGLEGAGVVCATHPLPFPHHCFEPGALCLAGGQAQGQGNVYLEGHPVCHNGWDFVDANVVCRSLGFVGASDFTIRSFFGLSTTFFRVSQVSCRGQESSLLECPHMPSGDECDSSTVAGVHCITNVREMSSSVPDLSDAVIGLSITVAILLLSLTATITLLLIKTGHLSSKKWRADPIKKINMTMKRHSLPSGSVENIIGQDYNEIYLNRNANEVS